MAGLHIALCLAERQPPSSLSAEEPRMTTEIVVLEGEEIGNGASGRAKGKLLLLLFQYRVF